MRLIFASSVSGLVHILGLGALAMWSLQHDGSVEYRVAAGQVITVRFAPSFERETSEQPVSLELPPDETPTPTETPEPDQRLEVQRLLAVVERADLLVRVDAPVSDLALELPRRAPAATIEPTDQPKIAAVQRPRRKPTSELPVTPTEAIPLEFEASAVAGANVADQWPRSIANPAPIYPQDALLAGVFERQVVVRVRVSADGRVKSVVVDKSSGWPSMDDSAVAAIRTWRFEPARSRGIPVEFEFRIPVEFGLRRS